MGRLPFLFRMLLAIGVAIFVSFSFAAEPDFDPAGIEFFEKKIRPLLAAHCYECHGPEEQESQLRLDSRAAIVRGGATGPAIVPGDPAKSLLIDAVRRSELFQMPPEEELSAEHVADLTAWVKMGAPWPSTETANKQTVADDVSQKAALTDDERRFWAFQPRVDPPPPVVQDTEWPESPLDRFILARLEQAGLRPAPPATKRDLIRRATFDLTGLPPSPDEIRAFLADDSPDALARLIDRLLASPRYGERWGRRWLDVARYADSNGMDENLAYVHAYRYRDYVIAAFNTDKPYDRFVREQLAGDLLGDVAGGDAAADRWIATGFLSLGPKMLAEDDPVKMRMDIVDEQVDTIGRALMGLTLGCARCHDHKFDPITMEDYYGLAGIFTSTKTMENHKVVAHWHERPVGTAEERHRLTEAQQAIAAKERELKLLSHPDGPFGLSDDAKRNDPADTAAELVRLRAELETLEKEKPRLPLAMGVAEGEIADLAIHLRGSHLRLGRKVRRRFPRILTGEGQPSISSDHSGRLELAHWLTSAEHPLTARVMANRIWQGHFGNGLVRTPDNFGRLGQRPTHPKLLDWLASRLVEGGWSVKAMHRQIMNSSAYRMSTAYNVAAAEADPENRLLWRMNRRRLDAEEIRDAILSASGSLDTAVGGSLLTSKSREYVTSTASRDAVNYDSSRRSVYLPVVRSAVYDVFQAFDFADPSTMTGRRATTTIAPQSLFMMNGTLVLKHTRKMAENLLSDVALDDAGRVRRLHLIAYGRPPTADETRAALDFVDRLTDQWRQQKTQNDPGRLRAWQSLCKVIIASNEFIYVE